MTANVKRRMWAALGGAIVGTVLFAAADRIVIRPLADENDLVRAQLDLLRSENERTEAMLADYESFRREADETELRFAVAITAVPGEADLAVALDDLERVTAASGVNLVRFAPGARTAPGPGGAAVAIDAQPITVAVRSGYDDFRGLLARLAGYERLLTVEGFTMRSRMSGAYTLEATIDLKCYFKRVPKGG